MLLGKPFPKSGVQYNIFILLKVLLLFCWVIILYTMNFHSNAELFHYVGTVLGEKHHESTHSMVQKLIPTF